MEKNQRESHKKSSVAGEKTKKARIGRELSRDDILRLIRLYRENECLWNYKRHQYNRFDLRNGAWEIIAKELHMSPDEAKRKMKSLRSTYLAEKKKLEIFRGSNPADYDKYISSLFYFDDLRFLDDAIIPRQCHSDSSTNKEKLDVDLLHSESKTSTTSSLMIIDDNEQEQQYYEEKMPILSHTSRKRQENIQSQETFQLDHDVHHQNSFSFSSFPSLSSNFHQVQRNRAQQQKHHEKMKHPHLSTLLTSGNKTMSQEPTRSVVQNAPCSSRSINLQYESNSENHGNRVTSKEILSAAYDLIQKDTNNGKSNENSENNLKSFGEFIDAELRKLDENSLAVAKMRINKILHEAALGMYKNLENKTDKSNKECDISTRERLNVVDDGETQEKSSSRKRSTENTVENNKENRIPTIFQYRNQDLRSDNSLEPQQASVFRKKRIKSKQILSAVYNVLSKEINNIESQHVSFGTYVCSELKAMNDETVKNVKLNICRVLYEASMGKYKNSRGQLLCEQTEEDQVQTDTEPELVTPKAEVIDTGYDV